MNTAIFNDVINLVEYCEELKARLEEAREELTEDQWQQIKDGPFGEVLAAAEDVENAIG